MHIDADTQFNFVYNGRFGFLDARLFAVINNRALNGHNWPQLISEFGKKNIVIYAMMNGEWRIFSRVLNHIPIKRKRETYDTFFGSMHASFVSYRASRHNFDEAMTRMTMCRDGPPGGDPLQYEMLCRRNQEVLLHRRGRFGRLWSSFLYKQKCKMRSKINQLASVFDEQLRFADKPHPKKKLRQTAIRNLVNRAALSGLFCEHVIAKLKMFERAKKGKRTRMIGDYTTEGSLLQGFLVELIKQELQTFVCHGLDLEFVYSVEPSVIDRVYLDCQELGTYHFKCHSDDILLVTPTGEIFEVDISACDSSISDPVAVSVERLVDNPQFLDILKRGNRQCRLPIKYCDPNSKSTLWLTPEWYTQSSGSTSTTINNTVASIAIGIMCFVTNATTPDMVRAAARMVGFDVSVERRTSWAQATFLKRGWDFDGSSKLALTPVLRRMFTCTGDLPGRGSFFDRATIWAASVADCYIHSGHFHLLKYISLKTQKRCVLPTDHLKHRTSQSCTPASEAFYMARYGMTNVELHEIRTYLQNFQFLDVFRLTGYLKASLLDYGVGD